MVLTDNQKKLWSEKLMDLANLSIGALVFGSLLSEGGINPLIIFLGTFLYFFFASISTYLGR
ncbi:MAG: hypothetical protein AAB110_01780 [Candidatus Desantisbacteria bacterium]